MKFGEKIISVLTLILILSASAQAQQDRNKFSDSGSGNGSIEREITDNNIELKEADLNLKSLEEAFTEIAEKIADMSEARIPRFDEAGEGFWQRMTESDRKNLIMLDDELIYSVNKSLRLLSSLKDQVISEQAVINTMEDEVNNYEQRGLKRKFKKLIREKKKDLRYKLESGLADGLLMLVRSVIFERRVEFLPGYFDYEPILMQKGFITSCESALCADQASAKLKNYVEMVNDIAKLRVKLLTVNARLKRVFNKMHKRTQLYDMQKGETIYLFSESRYQYYYRTALKLIEEAHMKTIATLHEKEIKDLNAQ